MASLQLYYHLVPGGQTWRIVGEYKPSTKLQDFMNDIFHELFFGQIGLKDALHQIPINEDDISKTCLTTPFGAFDYLIMLFGH